MVSLFTNVSINETLDLLRYKHKLPNHIHSLTAHCLSNTYFLFNGKRYRQTTRASMGSPLSLVFADIFMANLEFKALQSTQLKSKLWVRYVDDTFVVWPHRRNNLNLFLAHLNTQNLIKFTVEAEHDHLLPEWALTPPSVPIIIRLPHAGHSFCATRR